MKREILQYIIDKKLQEFSIREYASMKKVPTIVIENEIKEMHAEQPAMFKLYNVSGAYVSIRVTIERFGIPYIEAYLKKLP